MTSRLVVLSDLHIAPSGPLASFHSGAALAQLLHANARADTTLVLAGDVFDFLQIDRPATLDMPRAPELFQRLLADLAADPERGGILQGLAAVLRAGAPCILLPGNHDPELHHPRTREVLLGALGLPDDAPLTLHRDDAPWPTAIGGLEVLVGHGHRADPWNDIDPSAVRRALETGASDVALPPGSRLVTQVQNVFKRAVDAATGRPRFPFIDLLKPELPAVPLLLWYLDPGLAKEHLSAAFGLGVRTILRPFARWVQSGPVLGGAGQPGAAASPMAAVQTDAAAMAAAMADALGAELSPSDRAAPTATIRSAELWLEGHGPGADGTLAMHGGLRRMAARAALRHLSGDGSFFNKEHLSSEDRAVVEEYLPPGGAPRVAIFGHTHAARHKVLDTARQYINTGTWMDLMEMPAMSDSPAVEAWIDELEAGRVARRRRLTYAEVTTDGAFLREHTQD